MAVGLRVSVVGSKALLRQLKRTNPAINRRIVTESLVEIALKVQTNAANLQITGGGRGKGKGLSALPNKLTSRTGTLRRSIAVDRKPLPRAIEVGTDLVYGPIHEFGLGNFPERPFMGPALDAISPQFGAVVIKRWKREARL